MLRIVLVYAKSSYRNADYKGTADMTTESKLSPIGFFHTPKDMRELENWIAQARDPMVTTAAMMMWNLLVTEYDITPKK